MLNKPSKCCQISLHFCQNGEISPNLVTQQKQSNAKILFCSFYEEAFKEQNDPAYHSR